MLVAAALCVLAAGCGEPPVDLDVPQREPGQVVLDQAGILSEDEVAAALVELGPDAVALTFTSEQANLGLADRAGKKVLEAWNADVVLVAVAAPGDFSSDADGRQRFFGIVPADPFAVPGSLRERIVEQTIGDIAARNAWSAVFTTAAAELEAGLRSGALAPVWNLPA